MLHSKSKPWSALLLGLIASALIGTAHAERQAITQSNRVDVVIALDVSNSMDGLIGSAKQRLWDIVNELSRAQPQPELHMAILSYGNPSYGNESGFVRVDLPFTTNLDEVNKTLFELTTNGGDEYVARALSTAVDDLDWSTDPGALRVLFIAGNEGANQDPQIPVLQAADVAAKRGITVNTIYCGGETDGDASMWRQVAVASNGLFASINQDAAAVAAIATPMDDELAALNQELNTTYVPYGAAGAASRERQVEQDSAVAALSAPAMASRATAKAGSLYKNDSWDLVDAFESGKPLEEVAEEELPEVMQEMEPEERANYVLKKAEDRKTIQGRIQTLADERRDYIEKERAKLIDDEDKGLDTAIQEGLQTLAEAKGFTFEKGE